MKNLKKDDSKKTPKIDENMHLMVYGNIKIRDKETNEMLVNKRF